MCRYIYIYIRGCTRLAPHLFAGCVSAASASSRKECMCARICKKKSVCFGVSTIQFPRAPFADFPRSGRGVRRSTGASASDFSQLVKLYRHTFCQPSTRKSSTTCLRVTKLLAGQPTHTAWYAGFAALGHARSCSRPRQLLEPGNGTSKFQERPADSSRTMFAFKQVRHLLPAR